MNKEPYRLIKCGLNGSKDLPEFFFTQAIKDEKWELNITPGQELALLLGPAHDDYFEAWEAVKKNAVYTDKNGKWKLFEDLHVFLYHVENPIDNDDDTIYYKNLYNLHKRYSDRI